MKDTKTGLRPGETIPRQQKLPPPAQPEPADTPIYAELATEWRHSGRTLPGTRDGGDPASGG